MSSVTLQARLDAIWDEAERRYCAGEKPLRHIGGGYAPPAGDGDQGMRPWLSEKEADEAHELAQCIARMQRQYDAGASDRLRAKHSARRFAA